MVGLDHGWEVNGYPDDPCSIKNLADILARPEVSESDPPIDTVELNYN